MKKGKRVREEGRHEVFSTKVIMGTSGKPSHHRIDRQQRVMIDEKNDGKKTENRVD